MMAKTEEEGEDAVGGPSKKGMTREEVAAMVADMLAGEKRGANFLAAGDTSKFWLNEGQEMREGSGGFAIDDAYSSDGSGVGFLATQSRQKSATARPGIAYVTGTRKTSKLPPMSPGTQIMMTPSASKDA